MTKIKQLQDAMLNTLADSGIGTKYIDGEMRDIVDSLVDDRDIMSFGRVVCNYSQGKIDYLYAKTIGVLILQKLGLHPEPPVHPNHVDRINQALNDAESPHLIRFRKV